VEIANEFLSVLKIETRKNFPLKQAILNLVKYHHRIYDLHRNREAISFKAISRLVKDLEGQDFLLLLLDFADRRSREPDPLNFHDPDEIIEWYLAQKQEYNIDKETIQPIIMGRDLLKLGVLPGVRMGVYLRALYERQLDGEFSTREEGLNLFEKIRENTADEPSKTGEP
jgi:tRNA nucleotidyltransferase (CCA-adding enzyme)